MCGIKFGWNINVIIQSGLPKMCHFSPVSLNAPQKVDYFSKKTEVKMFRNDTESNNVTLSQ